MPSGVYNHYKLRKPKKIKVCAAPDCDNLFEVIVDGWNEDQKYCSHSCIRKGKHNSEDHKRKSGEGTRGRKHSPDCSCISCVMKRGEYVSKRIKMVCQWCGKEYMVDPCDEEKTSYCSRSCQGKGRSESMKGENNYNWKGGITNDPYPIGWTETLREDIRRKDGYICQFCGKTQEENGRRLSVHHINYDKENLDGTNLVALCTSCNVKVNYDREKWFYLIVTERLRQNQLSVDEAVAALKDRLAVPRRVQA